MGFDLSSTRALENASFQTLEHSKSRVFNGSGARKCELSNARAFTIRFFNHPKTRKCDLSKARAFENSIFQTIDRSKMRAFKPSNIRKFELSIGRKCELSKARAFEKSSFQWIGRS